MQGEGITLTGGNGSVLVAGLTAHNDVVQLGNGNDRVGLIGDNNQVTVGSGIDQLSFVGNNNQASTGAGFDVIAYQGEGDTFVLGGGTAVIGAYGFSGHATFIANGPMHLIANLPDSKGHDTVQLAGGTAALSLGGGGDRIDVRGPVQATIHNFSGVVDLLPSLGYSRPPQRSRRSTRTGMAAACWRSRAAASSISPASHRTNSTPAILRLDEPRRLGGCAAPVRPPVVGATGIEPVTPAV